MLACTLVAHYADILHGQNAGKNDDFSTIADADALLLVAGDPASEEEPTRKGTAFQVSVIPVSATAKLSVKLTWPSFRLGCLGTNFLPPSFSLRKRGL